MSEMNQDRFDRLSKLHAELKDAVRRIDEVDNEDADAGTIASVLVLYTVHRVTEFGEIESQVGVAYDDSMSWETAVGVGTLGLMQLKTADEDEL